MAVLRPKRRQLGQSMTEYTVIVIWGVLLVGNDTMMGAVDQLVTAMKNRHAGMVYGVSLSDPPQANSLPEYIIQIAQKKTEKAREDEEGFIAEAGTDVATYISDQLVGAASEQIGGAIDGQLDKIKDSLDMSDQLTKLWKPPSPKPGFSCQ